MNQHIEKKMTEKGYVKVQGMAVLNDVAVTVTTKNVLTPILSTNEAVDTFNNEQCDGWVLFRKSNISLNF